MANKAKTVSAPAGAMCPAERIANAFAGRPTDRVPVHHIGFSSRAASVILGREAFVGGGIQWYREACALFEGPEAHQAFLERSFRDALDLARETGQDLVRPTYWRQHHGKPDRRLDERTFLYGDPDGAYRVMRYDPETELYQEIDRHPRREMLLEDLERKAERAMADAAAFVPTEGAFAAELRARDELGGSYAIRCSAVHCAIPYDPCLWLEATIERPEWVARYLDAQAMRAVKLVKIAGRLGLPYLFGGGDCATNQGPMYAPRVFSRLLAPRLRAISEACRTHGCKHLFGSDGNLWPLADALFDGCGMDGYYEIDRGAGMDLRQLRERFPRLTLMGNISSRTLHLGTVEEVAAETRNVLEEARELGGVIVGVSNQVVPQSPPENLLAMLETLHANC